jgi:hypothetical protein
MTDGSYRFHGEGSVRLHQLPGWLIGWVNMSDKSSEPPPGSSGCYVRRATCDVLLLPIPNNRAADYTIYQRDSLTPARHTAKRNDEMDR